MDQFDRWKQGKKIAGQYIKEICARLCCSPEQFVKMRREIGDYKKAMIQLIVHLRNKTEWTYRHIEKYLKYNAEHVERLYYCEKREGI